MKKQSLHTFAVGLLLAAGSFLAALYFALRFFIHGTPVAGWTSTIVSVWFLGGSILANLGVIGLYLGRVFNETKNRPLYVVRSRIGFPEEPRNPGEI